VAGVTTDVPGDPLWIISTAARDAVQHDANDAELGSWILNALREAGYEVVQAKPSPAATGRGRPRRTP
jgi:hypothetical protein